MITLKIPFTTSPEELEVIKMLQKQQASVYHCVYNLFINLHQNFILGMFAESERRLNFT